MNFKTMKLNSQQIGNESKLKKIGGGLLQFSLARLDNWDNHQNKGRGGGWGHPTITLSNKADMMEEEKGSKKDIG